MKFMVSSWQPLTFLKKVQEIRVNYRDIERLYDFITEDWTCEADIVIYIPHNQIVNWKEIDNFKNILNLTIAVEDTAQIQEAKNLGYKVFWAYAVSSYWELQGILNLGVNQVLLDAPLYFDLPKVKQICGEVEIRLVVNKCMNSHIKQKDGICGTYVRPEDVSEYEPFVSHMEFDTDSFQKEYTLYKIYADDKQWPGDLNLLLTYLNTSVDNRGFEALFQGDEVKSFARRRLTCKQKCQENACKYCPNLFKLIDTLSQTKKEY